MQKKLHTFETFVPKKSEERFTKPYKKYTIDVTINVGFDGEWYDGPTWEDGVPYVEGYMDFVAKDEKGNTVANAHIESDDEGKTEWQDIFEAARYDLEEKWFGEYNGRLHDAMEAAMDAACRDEKNYDQRVYPLTKLMLEVTVSANGYVVEHKYLGCEVEDQESYNSSVEACLSGEEDEYDEEDNEE